MSWNYRIVHRVQSGEDCFGIHEAYYNPDGSIWAISEEPIAPFGNTKKELIDDHAHMTEAIIKPVLEYTMEFKKRAERTK